MCVCVSICGRQGGLVKSALLSLTLPRKSLEIHKALRFLVEKFGTNCQHHPPLLRERRYLWLSGEILKSCDALNTIFRACCHI